MHQCLSCDRRRLYIDTGTGTGRTETTNEERPLESFTRVSNRSVSDVLVLVLVLVLVPVLVPVPVDEDEDRSTHITTETDHNGDVEVTRVGDVACYGKARLG